MQTPRGTLSGSFLRRPMDATFDQSPADTTELWGLAGHKAALQDHFKHKGRRRNPPKQEDRTTVGGNSGAKMNRRITAMPIPPCSPIVGEPQLVAFQAAVFFHLSVSSSGDAALNVARRMGKVFTTTLGVGAAEGRT